MAYPPNLGFDRTTNESLEELLANVANRQTHTLGQESLLYRSVRSLTIHTLLLILASIYFVLWINTNQTPCPLDPLRTYSPVNEVVQYVEKHFDGRIDSISIFRGYPRAEMEFAWRNIAKAKAIRLTRQQHFMSGWNDSTAVVKFRPEDGGGYMSQIDAYHHIHCLGMLRKNLRPEYYASAFDELLNGNRRQHLAHCIEMLRQKFMCTSDLTMISYDWIPGFDNPQPNLSAIHQCMNYERIMDWSVKHNAHVLKSHVVMFGDATELPSA